ncbi:MAG TPA: DMT family transporter [Candidatus Bathyarchaeia archaeon]|nr:DMT family transporter [Candidatus Bathyarchaeia archaeon]
MIQRTGLLATILSGIMFGTSIPAIKLGLDQAQIPPILFATLRFLVASALVVLLLRKQGWIDGPLLKSRPIWIIGILNTVGYILQFEGQALTTASDAALVIGSAALMIPVASWLNGTEKLVWSRTLGVVLGFVGTALVVTRGEPLVLGGPQVLGDILILGTAVTIALIFILTKSLVVKEGSRAVTGGIILTTAVLLVPFVPLDTAGPVSLGLDAWFYILFLAVLSTVGAYFFFARGLETVSPTVSSIILPIEVIVSVGLSVLIFRDPFNFLSGTGAVLIIAGVLLLSFSS